MGENEKTMSNRPDRSPSNNRHIYRYFTEEEINGLTDEEFVALKKKMNPYFTLSPVSAKFDTFMQKIRSASAFTDSAKADFAKADMNDLRIYERLLTAEQSRFGCFERYAHIFSFCRALGVTNLYDIGCGHQLQASLLIHAPDIYYTGIDDRFISFFEDFEPNPDYLNQLFESFLDSDRIRFIMDEYPCKLSVRENNIAAAIGSLRYEPAVAKALSRDFERILIDLPSQEFDAGGLSAKDIANSDINIWKNPFEKYYSLWKSAMPEYKFYKIGGHLNYIFGTKKSCDEESLAKKYTVKDNCITAGLFDIEWAYELFIPAN